MSGGLIGAMRAEAPRGARSLSVRGDYVAPGFVDLHVWGDPERLSRELPRRGTTAFLTALGPEPPAQLATHLAQRERQRGALTGAQCLGAHLEGPFLNPKRGGALPSRWMRRPSIAELRRLTCAGVVRLMTIAPELRGAGAAIRWCREHGVLASLGHSDAAAEEALRGVDAGAGAVTHVFNGMRPFHHRRPALLDIALADPRLTAMAILDGVHISPWAFRWLVRAKGAERVALVTDSIARQGWDVVAKGRAYYTKRGILAGSRLTMLDAVRHAVRWGGVSLAEAVRMASEVPARLIGVDQTRGALRIGRRADVTVFDERFRVQMTLVGGRAVYHR